IVNYFILIMKGSGSKIYLCSETDFADLRDKILYGSDEECADGFSELIDRASEAGYNRAKRELQDNKPALGWKKYIKGILIVILIGAILCAAVFVFNAFNDNKSESNAGNATSQQQMVWIGETGTKYHREDCQTLRGSKYQITLEEALNDGRTACKICQPVSYSDTLSN
ncbi:MAG: hypothetical protein ACI4SS_01775, partial [Clostridia bacterium]